MPSVSVGDTVVHYTVAGQGPPVVLVHGVGGDATTTWAQASAALTDRHTVIAPDLAGTTRTPAASTIEFDDLVEQVVAVVEAETLEHYHLVGYSLGGAVAAATAARHGDRVVGLTAIAGWASTDVRGRAMFDLWARAFAADSDLFVRLAVVTGFGPGFFAAVDDAMIAQVVDSFSSIIAPGTDQQATAAAGVDITDALGAVTAPTRVIGLEHDQHVPPGQARALADAIANSEYSELATGHLLPWENPELFVATVADAVSELSRTS